MPIDYDAYLNLDTKDLDKIISHTKNIIQLRNKKTSESLKELNLDKLKDSLVNNKNKKIPSSVWKDFEPRAITSSHIDFFLYVKNLPGFNGDDDGFVKKNIDIIATKTFNDKKLFDLFINNEELHPALLKQLEIGAFTSADKEIVEYIFDNNLVEINKKLIDTIIKERSFNCLNYLIEKQSYSFSEEEKKNIYCRFISFAEGEQFQQLKDFYPEYFKLNLANYIDTINISGAMNNSADPYYQRYKTFSKFNANHFLEVLSNHTMASGETDILLTVFDNTFQTQGFEGNFKIFIDFIFNHYPEFIDEFHAYKPKDKNFKKAYEKVLEYSVLQKELGRKENIVDKKFKI